MSPVYTAILAPMRYQLLRVLRYVVANNSPEAEETRPVSTSHRSRALLTRTTCENMVVQGMFNDDEKGVVGVSLEHHDGSIRVI